MRFPIRLPLLFWTVCFGAVCLAGCEGDAPGGGRGAAAGSGCGQANLTQRCTCSDGATGAQTCDGAAWSACSCLSLTTGGGSGGVGGGFAGTPGTAGTSGSVEAGTGSVSDPGSGPVSLDIPDGIVFDWNPKVPFPDGTCEPGFYLGLFDGFYGSPAAFQFPVPVVGDVNLTLGESVDGENFEVSDGTVDGTADFIFPFSANIVGTLNCTTSTFTGELVDGTYNVFGVDFFFSGPVTADYNRRTHAFEMGTWNVEEPPADPAAPPPVPAGGDGTWNATLQP